MSCFLFNCLSLMCSLFTFRVLPRRTNVQCTTTYSRTRTLDRLPSVRLASPWHRIRPHLPLTPVGNGAYTVTCHRLPRRSISCSQPRTLTNLRDCSSSDVRDSSLFDRHPIIASLNVRSLGNKIDDLLEVRQDRSIDVLCLVETWHDTDAVCFRRLRSDGFQVTD